MAVLLTALVCCAATVAIVLFPQLHGGYRQFPLHVALETFASFIVLLACLLVLGRLRRRARLNELALTCSLAVITLSDMFFVTIPALRDTAPQNLPVWAAFAGTSIGTVAFCAAAFLPDHELRRPGRALAVGASGVALVLWLTAFLTAAFGGGTVRLSAVMPPLSSSVPPGLRAYQGLFALQLVTAVICGAAAVRCMQRLRWLHDEFYGWLAIAAVLAAASYLDYSLYPGMYVEPVYIAGFLRLAFYVILLTGSTRGFLSHWNALSRTAVLEERSRIARDLHDGLAQELAFLARHLDSLSGNADDDTLRCLRSTAERAQLESRRAIMVLADVKRQAADVAITEAAGEVARRLGVELDLSLARDVRLSPARVDALVRISREAVANAARHGGARRVSLRLTRDGSRVLMRISDRGGGFDTTVAHDGFGLTSMAERARLAGGELDISSRPGSGSTVEVVL